MLSRVPSQSIKSIPDAAAAKELASQMQDEGIESLDVDVDHSPQKSLGFLSHFGFLKYLSVGGKARDLEAIASLGKLKELCLLRVAVSDFVFLAGLKNLRLFEMRFGGCKSFESLEVVRGLIGLAFMRLPTLTSLDFVSAMPDLQRLHLDSCKGIERLPDLQGNPKLRRIVLATMNGLKSLAGLEKAAGLEDLIIMESYQLDPDEFARVPKCPKLRGVLAGVGLMNSARYRRALEHIPERQRMDGYYGTENTRFSFRGYKQPSEDD